MKVNSSLGLPPVYDDLPRLKSGVLKGKIPSERWGFVSFAGNALCQSLPEIMGMFQFQYPCCKILTKGVVELEERYKSQYTKFGLNVFYYRKKNRLTQSRLAELVDIHRTHMSAIERGVVAPSFDVLFKLSDVLGIETKQLFDFRGE